jgi:hypothetical protein
MPVTLIDRDWPDFGAPAVPPPVGRAELAARLALIRDAMAAAGLDALVIYGDREHFGEPPLGLGFRSAIRGGADGRAPRGPAAPHGRERMSGLHGPRPPSRPATSRLRTARPSRSSRSRVRATGSRSSSTARCRGAAAIGTVGWKYWTAEEVGDPEHALEIPSLLADLLRAQGGRGGERHRALHASRHRAPQPRHGGRDRAARIRQSHGGDGGAADELRLREGATDFDVFAAGGLGGLPLGCHATFATGPRPFGLSGPTGARIERGRTLSFNVCHWGANVCRAGWLAEGTEDLPAEARDYLEAFVGPYLEAMDLWCGLMRPGVPGGEVQAAMDAALPGFGVTLNPGHLIGMDEWVSSPIQPGSAHPIRSGMAMQMDVIPDHPVYGSTRMEDGYIIADAALRAALEATHPMVAARIERRRGFMREAGYTLPDSLLPLADTCGVVAPYLLAPRSLAVLRA